MSGKNAAEEASSEEDELERAELGANSLKFANTWKFAVEKVWVKGESTVKEGLFLRGTAHVKHPIFSNHSYMPLV